jgi:TolB-like protein/Tfp pilus assembly protein PilF
MNLITELKRRNVIRVGIAYLVGAWLLAQAADLVLDVMGAPDIILQSLVAILALGFIPAVIFAWAFELTPEGIKRESEVNRTESITNITAKKLDFVTIGMLVAVLAVVAIDRFLPSSESSGERIAAEQPTEQAQASAQPEPSGKSIAVLPFVNMSEDANNEFFSDGISEEILNALAKVKDLKVAGRTSSFVFKGENQDLRQIGETLGVSHILEGSVRKAGNRVRVTAQLIQADDGFHMWSENYDRELDDVFAIQDEIANAILDELKAHLLADEQSAIQSVRTDTDAYELYLLAKQRIYQRSKPTLEAAADMLDKAIAIDSKYAPAYAQRAIATILLSDEDYGDIPLEEALTQGKVYIDQALRLNPDDPEALSALGLYYNNQPGKKTEAIAALEAALAINPNLVNASNWLQGSYGAAGRPDKALAILEDLVERDPLYRPALGNISNYYSNMGKTDQLEALIERIKPSMPNDPFLLRLEATVLYAQAEYAKGLRRAEEALALRPDNYPNQGLVGQGLLTTGQYERLANEGHPWQKVIGLWALGRAEEATLLAQQEADSGRDVGSLIGLLANSGEQQAAVDFVEQRWDSLQELEDDYPLLGNSPMIMLDVAYAYSSIGNEDRFSDAMARYRRAMDAGIAMGFRGNFVNLVEAVYFTLAGDPQAALAQLDQGVNDGLVIGGKLANAWAAFKTLEGDPEYEAIQARMIEHLNEERAELGLEPVLI